jgi:hypothetical protein
MAALISVRRLAAGTAVGRQWAAIALAVFVPDGEPFGYERVMDTFAGAGAHDPEEAVRVMVRAAESYRAGEAIADDVTILVLRKRGA